MPDLENDQRLDPRVKWALRNVPVTNLTDVDRRETLLEISNHPKAVAMREKGAALYDALNAASRGDWNFYLSLADGEAMRVMDVGCGSGVTPRRLACPAAPALRPRPGTGTVAGSGGRAR